MLHQILGEFMGTLVLILMGNGVVANVLLKKSKAEGAGWMVIAAGWGFAVMCGAYTSIAFGSLDAHLWLSPVNARVIAAKMAVDLSAADPANAARYQSNLKAFDERLTKLGIAHEFHLYPGDHGWAYMISVADHSYTFLWKNFKTDAKGAAPVRSRAGK